MIGNYTKLIRARWLVIFGCAAISFIATSALFDHTLDIDYFVANLFYTLRTYSMVKFFSWVTLLGGLRIILPLIIVASFGFWIWGKRIFILPFIASFFGGYLASYAFKEIWVRSRPSGLIPVYLYDSWSFPSGHAMSSVVFFGFLIYFFWKNFKNWKYKISIVFAGFLFIIMIGFSRIYLGAHYLSDVLAGYMVGLMALMVCIGWLEWKLKKIPD